MNIMEAWFTTFPETKNMERKIDIMKKQWKEFMFFIVNLILLLVIKYAYGEYALRADSFGSKAWNITAWLMAISVGYVLLLIKGYKVGNGKKVLIFAGIGLFLISTAMLTWLLLHKESFHWNYDITGNPVDHYSTYGGCIAYTVISMVYAVIGVVGNITAGVAYFKKNCCEDKLT